MGNFKKKDRSCYSCGRRWVDHEEKETDVNIAIHLIARAAKDEFDRALLVTGDSDLAPAVRMLRQEYPQKSVRILAPLNRGYSMELLNAAGGKENCRKLRAVHLERCLLPQEVRSESGLVVATRPAKYDPPVAG